MPGACLSALVALVLIQTPPAPAGPATIDSVAPSSATSAPSNEVIAQIIVHGNQITPEADVIQWAGVSIGSPFGPTTIADIVAHLRATKRFRDVQVLKRLASIDDASQIALVIIVDDGPVRIEAPKTPGGAVRIVRRRGPANLLFMPILDAEDGYGLTYGVEIAEAGVTGKTGRLAFPLTWGGMKRAGVEFDRSLTRGPLTRVDMGAELSSQTNPAFEQDDNRRRIWARAERRLGVLVAGATLGRDYVSFGDVVDHMTTLGVDATVDTRVDPMLSRNAIYASAHWTRQGLASAGAVHTAGYEARGYLGLLGQSILVARVVRESANAPLPPYLEPLLGGWSNLRGFKAGAFAGDTLVAGSLELREPLSSPAQLFTTGVTAFIDAGTVYPWNATFDAGAVRVGIGGGVWIGVAGFRLNVSVAHGRGAGTRVNSSLDLAF